MKLRNFRHAVFSSVALSALSISGIAYAQEETSSPQAADETPAVTSAPQSTEDEARQEKIVVTGSLLRRDQFTAAAPIQVVTSEVATLEGLIDAADVLQSASVASGSTQMNTQFGAFVVEGGPGVNTVSLRGLGAQRTLVVFNGRRLGPAGVQGSVGAVDLNVIPQSVVQRYEILKDGASSIYGSDAVAGVINVITRTSIDRPELTVRANAPFDGGGETFGIDGAFGLNFDSGNITFSASYDRFERQTFGDRSFTSCGNDYMVDVNTNQPVDITALTPNRPEIHGNPICFGQPTGNMFGAWGVNFRAGATADHYFVPDNNSAGKPGSQLIDGFRLIGTDNDQLGRLALADLTGYRELDWSDPRTLNADLLPQVERFSFYSTASFDLGNGELYGELLYNRRETQQKSMREFFPTLGIDHAFFQSMNLGPTIDLSDVFGLPAGSLAEFAEIEPDIFVNEFTANVLAPMNADIKVDYIHAVAGYTGDFGANAGFLSNWNYDVHVSHSRSDGTYDTLSINRNNMEDNNSPGNDIAHSIDASGNIVCTRISTGESCPVVNYFTPDFLMGNFTPEQRNFLFAQDKGKTVFEQSLFNAILTGEAFELPAGKIGAAVGVQYREMSIDDQPGELSVSGAAWGAASAGRTKGDDSVFEAFAEVEVPVLKGKPFFEELTLNGSIRYFDYEAFGSDHVYKVGANWQINPLLRLRSTYGTSFRAPALYERFLANQTGFASQNADPCRNWGLSTNETLRANCAALDIPENFNAPASDFTVVRGGGEDLTPETSESLTFGAVFTPASINLSVALDYFDIEVTDQIAVIGASGIIGACYGRENFPNAFCDLIERNSDPTSASHRTIVGVLDNYVNINSQRTTGLDLNTRYEHEFTFGDLAFDLAATWTFKDETDVFGGLDGFETNDFNSTVGEPNFVGNSNIQFKRGDWTYSWFSNFVGRTSNEKLLSAANPFTYLGRPDTWRKRYTENTIYHGASVRYRSDEWQVVVGINNIFDEAPPAISSGAGSTRIGVSPIFGTQYDLRGRTGFVQVSKSF